MKYMRFLTFLDFRHEAVTLVLPNPERSGDGKPTGLGTALF